MPTWLEKVTYKLHGAKDWPWADAKVFDFSTEPAGRNSEKASVSYSFWLDGHIYSSIAVWYQTGFSDSTAYRKDDTIQIQYNSGDPNQSYFPEQENLTSAFYGVIALSVVIIFAVVLVIANIR